MNLQNLFHKTDAYWVKYSEYECRESDGELFVVPTETAQPTVYDPLKIADELVVDALNVGLLCMQKNIDTKPTILDFVAKYGLLGFMTALPTTPNFTDYSAVYLPKNPIIKVETMDTNEYVKLFFPFNPPDFQHTKETAALDVSGNREQLALAMTFGNSPLAANMGFQRGYAEWCDWLRGQFRDWAYSLCACVFFYEETDDTARELHRRAMSAFGGISPHYRIALYDDKPALV
ncbi:hypothetical protein FACS189492_0050 [Clostridia bacterium]|nr:hypothetical protein FACS189492_0050 [Clostridia bacterium]